MTAALWIPLAIGHLSFIALAWLNVPATLANLLLIPAFLDCLAFAIVRVIDADDCTTAAGYAGSISKVSASIMHEGYVFMFVSLTLVAYVVTTRVDWNIKRRVRIHATPFPLWRNDRYYINDIALQWGAVIVVLTAVIPDYANNCVLDPLMGKETCRDDALHYLHIAGIGAGVLISTVCALIRAGRTVADHWNTYANTEYRGRASASFALLLLCASIMAGFLIAFLRNSSELEPPAVHICINYHSEGACHGDELPARLRAAALEIDEPLRNKTAGVWPCVWNDDALSEQAPCTDPRCADGRRMEKLSFGLVAEFNGLFLWLIVSAHAEGSLAPPALPSRAATGHASVPLRANVRPFLRVADH